MADGVTVDTQEVARLTLDLHHAGPFAIAEAHEIIQDGMALVVRIAQTLVPVKTGATRDSIGFDMLGQLEAEAGPTTWYAPMLEYGTAKMAPRPFMGPALDSATDEIVDAFNTIGIPGVSGGVTSVVASATLTRSAFAGARTGTSGLSSGSF